MATTTTGSQPEETHGPSNASGIPRKVPWDDVIASREASRAANPKRSGRAVIRALNDAALSCESARDRTVPQARLHEGRDEQHLLEPGRAAGLECSVDEFDLVICDHKYKGIPRTEEGTVGLVCTDEVDLANLKEC